MATPTIKFTRDDLSEQIARCIEVNEVPMVIGKPGIGKSAIHKQVAEEFNYLFIDIRLTGKEASDIQGIPNFVDIHNDKGAVIGKRVHFVPTDLFPLKDIDDDKLNERDADGKVTHTYDGFYVLLEELPDVSEDVQKACYQILHDRMVGQYHLHPKVVLAAAGNGADQGGLANEMVGTIISRGTVIHAELNYKIWMNWATANNVDTRIISYLRWKPENLYNYDSNAVGEPFACPRTWTKLSKLLKADPNKEYDGITHKLALGQIGKVAVEFKAFNAYFEKLPSLDAILADPKNADMPKETGQIYALTGVLSQAMLEAIDDNDKLNALVSYMERMPSLDYQAVTITQALSKTYKIVNKPAITAWISKHHKVINAIV